MKLLVTFKKKKLNKLQKVVVNKLRTYKKNLKKLQLRSRKSNQKLVIALKSNVFTTKRSKKDELIAMKPVVKKILMLITALNVVSFVLLSISIVKRFDVISEITFKLFLVALQIASVIAIFSIYNWVWSRKHSIRIKSVKTRKI